jgi:hypothetical protein
MCGLNEDPYNFTTIIVPFLHVNSGNIKVVMSCGSEGVIRHPRSVSYPGHLSNLYPCEKELASTE